MAPAAGPSLIRIGHYLANIEPKALQEHVQTLVPLLDSHGVIEYTILVASALLVSMTFVCVPEYMYVCGWGARLDVTSLIDDSINRFQKLLKL